MTAFATTLTGTSASELIIAEDVHRDHITIQSQGFNSVYLGFGEPAVLSTGICLLVAGCSVRVTGNKARQAVYGCSEGEIRVGIETCEDIEYRPGSFIWFF